MVLVEGSWRHHVELIATTWRFETATEKAGNPEKNERCIDALSVVEPSVGGSASILKKHDNEVCCVFRFFAFCRCISGEEIGNECQCYFWSHLQAVSSWCLREFSSSALVDVAQSAALPKSDN